ncbi:hypothetical protein LP7551_00514 [Roseibium album]|nr:hypothetical protein LP7551_00514 [Roseibium album]
MLTTGLESTAFGKTTDADTDDMASTYSSSKFHPIMGKNISIQAIVEGSLLAEIELDPIPEYGIHL